MGLCYPLQWQSRWLCVSAIFRRLTFLCRKKSLLDIIFCLYSESYQLCRKPNGEPLHISRNSNHPPTILSRLPQTISMRISSLSSNYKLFSRAAPIYNAALQNAGYAVKIYYNSEINENKPSRNRKCSFIWYSPPYNNGVCTNIGHFFKEYKLDKILLLLARLINRQDIVFRGFGRLCP